MTATPKIYGENVKSKVEEDTVITSMDDKETFGEILYYLSFGEGVQKGFSQIIK